MMEPDRVASDHDALTPLNADILSFIEAEPDKTSSDQFDDLAKKLFAFQFAHMSAYRGFCEARGAGPENIRSWTDIPAIPSAAFKSLRLATFPERDTEHMLQTSGTSGQTPGKIYLDAPGYALAAASWRRFGEVSLFPDRLARRALLLIPPLAQAPQMAIVHAVSAAFSERQNVEPHYFVDKGSFDMPGLLAALEDAERSNRPVAIFGASFSYVHLMDGLKDRQFRLAPGSLLMDGGGYKGRSRELTPEEFAASIQRIFGIPYRNWLNVLGMTEMLTGWADYVAADGTRAKRGTHWTRTEVVSPETLTPLPRGEVGLLKHCCLANRSTVMSVQTDDLGRAAGDGFEILGRATGAEARGCSIAMDELLSATADKI